MRSLKQRSTLMYFLRLSKIYGWFWYSFVPNNVSVNGSTIILFGEHYIQMFTYFIIHEINMLAWCHVDGNIFDLVQ